MEFDFNFLWGAILGAVLMAVIMFLWRNKNGAKSIFKKPPIPAFKKERSPKIKRVDDTPPDSDWPDAKKKRPEEIELDKAIARGDKKRIKELIAKEEQTKDGELELTPEQIAVQEAFQNGDIKKLRELLNEEDISPREKARLAALEESNPMG